MEPSAMSKNLSYPASASVTLSYNDFRQQTDLVEQHHIGFFCLAGEQRAQFVDAGEAQAAEVLRHEARRQLEIHVVQLMFEENKAIYHRHVVVTFPESFESLVSYLIFREN